MQETKEVLDKLDGELRAKFDGMTHRILVLEKFKTQYLEEVQEYRIPELHETLRTQVGRAIHIAATNHYDDFDEVAGEQLSKQIGEICQEECSAFLEQEQDIWDRKRWELEDGLDVDMGVSMQDIEIGAIDTGSAGDTVSKLFKYAAWANWLAPGGPLVKLGLSVGMGVLSSIFGRSTEEKIADLEKEINKKVEPVFDKVVDSVIEALNGGIIANMNSFEVMLEEVEELYRSVGDENVEAYNKLYYRLQDIDKTLADASNALLEA